MRIFPWLFCLLAYSRLSGVVSETCDGEVDLLVILDGRGETQESWWNQVVQSLREHLGRGPFSWDKYTFQVKSQWIDFARPIPRESDTIGYFDPDLLVNGVDASWDVNVQTNNSLQEALKTFTEVHNRPDASKMIVMFTDGNFENAAVSEEAASKLKTDFDVLFVIVGVGSFDRAQFEKITTASDYIFDGTSDEKLGLVNDYMSQILMAILCDREMPRFGDTGSETNDQSTTEETPCPGPAGTTDSPLPTPEPTGSPLPTPGPTGSPLPTPEPTGSPLSTPEPTGSPPSLPVTTDSPLPTPEPTGSPLPTPEPTGSPLSTPGPTDGSTPSGAVPCGSPTPGL